MKLKQSDRNNVFGSFDIYDMVPGDIFLEYHYDDVWQVDHFKETEDGKVMIGNHLGEVNDDLEVVVGEEYSTEFFYSEGNSHYGPKTFLVEIDQ